MAMNAEGRAVDGNDIESSLLRLNIESDNDGCNDDIEALVSRANDLSTHFAIGSPGDDDDELEGDYESITTDEGDSFLPHETGEEMEGLSPGTAGNDFALAERTSNIISSYRDYLTQIDAVTATNRRLTEEMDSLRGSLGVTKVSSPTHTEPARTTNLHSREIGEIEFQEEFRANKYSQPLLHSRQIKKRLLGATLSVAVFASVAIASYYAAESAHAKNVPDWDGELAQAMAEEEATKESMIQEASSRWASTGMVQRATNTTQEDESNEVHAESPAVTIIEDLIAHPEDVDKVTAVSTEGGQAGTISKKGSKSQKAFASKSAKSSSVAKSGKTTEPKADKKSTSTSKSGKSSAMSVPVESNASETPPSTLASFSVTDEPKEEAEEPQLDSVEDEPVNEEEEATMAVAKEDEDEPATEEEEEESSVTLARPSGEVKKKQHNPAAIIQSVMSAKHTRAADSERLHTESAQILYEAISAEYNPLFFDRSHGWEGKTFGEAAYFCDQHYPHDMHGHPGIPCPYEVYCPEGPNSIPYGGYRRGTSFAPMIESQEHWIGFVQLSQGHSCMAYNDLRPAPTYEQMDLIMCCKDTTR